MSLTMYFVLFVGDYSHPHESTTTNEGHGQAACCEYSWTYQYSIIKVCGRSSPMQLPSWRSPKQWHIHELCIATQHRWNSYEYLYSP